MGRNLPMSSDYCIAVIASTLESNCISTSYLSMAYLFEAKAVTNLGLAGSFGAHLAK